MDVGVLSALAAVGALFFAWETVRETRKLRREERLARLPPLVGEIVETALRGKPAKPGMLPEYATAKLQLIAAIRASSAKLPECEALVDADPFDPAVDFAKIVTLADAALLEITVLDVKRRRSVRNRSNWCFRRAWSGGALRSPPAGTHRRSC